MAREQRYLFIVMVKGLGSYKIVAETKWVAIDRVYSTFQFKEADRSKYNARKTAF